MLTCDDTETLRLLHWFDSIQDLGPTHLAEADYSVAKRLYDSLGLQPPIRPTQKETPPMSDADRRREVDRRQEEIQDATDTRVAIGAASAIMERGTSWEDLKALAEEIEGWLRTRRKGGA